MKIRVDMETSLGGVSVECDGASVCVWAPGGNEWLRMKTGEAEELSRAIQIATKAARESYADETETNG